MKQSTRLSDAVHILVFIKLNENTNEICSSNRIAYSVKTNPSYIRQLMMKLKKSNIIECVHGHAMPKLKKDVKEITLYDIYKSVDENKNLLQFDSNINEECDIGVNIQYVLKDYYEDIQKKVERELKNITLMDVINKFKERIGD